MKPLTLACLLLLGGCAAEGGEPDGTTWRYASASPDCAPFDGPATTVLLSDSVITDSAVTPYLRISAYVAVPRTEVQAGIGGNGPAGASAGLCETGRACVWADQGWVRIRPAGGGLDGSYDITLHDGRRLTGRFSAPMANRPRPLCG